MGAESQRSERRVAPRRISFRGWTRCARDPQRHGPLPQSAGFSSRLMIVTFLCGDWQHVRLDGVKCDTAALGIRFSRIRQVGYPTLRRTLCSREP